jgi:hypothetical protein
MVRSQFSENFMKCFAIAAEDSESIYRIKTGTPGH